MTNPLLSTILILTLSAGAAACGEDSGSTPTDAGSTSDDAAPGAATDAAPGSSTDAAVSASCGGARVLIQFFRDAACTDMAGMRTYDTARECFSWTAAGSNASENSATRFQCYRDRLCYTQHADSLTCEGARVGPTDKEAKLGVCIKEPSGSLYSKLISGTESCPEAPAGFECPASASGAGTAGIVACTSGS